MIDFNAIQVKYYVQKVPLFYFKNLRRLYEGRCLIILHVEETLVIFNHLGL